MTRRKPDPILELSVEEITPDVAVKWLEYNTHNRKVSDKLVLSYAELMMEGEWRLNGEPIIFDKTGRLQSGQHRLLAVIEANTTITSVVVRGAEPDALYTLDRNRSRKMTDILTLMGETDVAVLSSCLSWTWRWENKLMDRQGENPNHVQLIRILEEQPELREERAKGRQVAHSFKVSPGLMTAVYHQLYRINKKDCDNFWDHIVEGVNLEKDHPAYAWRRWINNQTRIKDRSPSLANIAAITVKAWNKYRAHETVPRSLSWDLEEGFPEAE